MIFEKITVKNIGPFYGTQTVVVKPKSKEKNMTVIMAENYAGKTSFLRAVYWCLYDEIIKDDNNKTPEIFNTTAKAENCDEYSAEIFLSHEGRSYSIKRSCSNSDDKHFSFSEIVNGDYRNQKTKEEAKREIEKIAPRELAKFFFLKGENCSVDNKPRDITNSMRNILGLDDYDKAVFHTKNAEKAVLAQIKKLPKNDQAQEIDDRRQRYTTELEDLENELESEIIRSDKLNERIVELEKYHGSDEQIRQLNQQIATLENEIVREKKILRDLEVKKYRWFRREKFSQLLSGKLANKVSGLLDEKRYKGMIPDKYQKSFISDILESQNCICSRNLEKDSNEYMAVMQLLNDGGDVRCHDIISDLKADIKNMKTDRFDLVQSMNEINAEIDRCHEGIESKQSKKTVCENKKYSLADDGVKKKVDECRAKQKELRDCNQNIGVLRNKKENLIKGKEQADKEYKDAVSGELEARDLDEYLEFIRNIKLQIDSKKKKLEKDAKQALCTEIQNIVNRYMPEKPRITINDKFLYETNEGYYTSGGPKRLLDFAFTASILNFNRSGNRLLTHNGLIIPLVIDSTFGETDGRFRQALAKFLPELSEQVIVLATDTQSYVFVDAARESVCATYYITRELKQAADGGADSPPFHIGETAIKLIKYNCERDRSLIEELKNAA